MLLPSQQRLLAGHMVQGERPTPGAAAAAAAARE